MRITKDTRLEDIQQAFSERFKGLKLDFFKKPHLDTEASSKKSMITTEVKVKDLNSAAPDTEIKWSASMTVSGVEQGLENQLGLHAQVFRLTGTSWIETTTTDDYTLEKQMKKSAETQTAIH